MSNAYKINENFPNARACVQWRPMSAPFGRCDKIVVSDIREPDINLKLKG